MKNFFTKRWVFSVATLSLGGAAIFGLALPTLKVSASTFIPLTGQVNVWERSSNVTNLQMFLASDQNLYPEGLVTGYYGPLTKAAVIRFQERYGIDPVGRVGPVTLVKINSLIQGGGFSGVADVSGPQFVSMNKTVTSNSATFTWGTNENATAKIFYFTSPITMNEGDINSVGFGSTNGWTITNDGLSRTSQQVTITGLTPNTIYYYVIVATDVSGNVSVWNPNTTFKTSF